VFGDIQHMTHNLGLQGKWIHLAFLMHSGGRLKASIALATNAEAGATLLRQGSYLADALRTLMPSLSMSAFEGKADIPDPPAWW
jgi:hypothetical protein